MAKGRNFPPRGKLDDRQPIHSTNDVASPIVGGLRDLPSNIKPGGTISMAVCGREVVFTLKNIPAAHVEKKTLVWGENERLQELLTESALDDLIPSFVSGGQLVPAFAREVRGLVEVADGSRRRKTAILTGCDYRVLVGELDDEQMASLSQTGNNYRQTSAYERGRRYQRLLENRFNMNVSALASAEKVDRKIITRCIATARLPLEVIKLFSNPSELSARAGVDLSGIYDQHAQEMMAVANGLSERRANGEVLKAEEVIEALKQAGQQKKEAKQKPTVRKFADGVTAKYDGDNVSISLRGASPELLSEIEMVLEKAGKPSISESVVADFEKLERMVGKK